RDLLAALYGVQRIDGEDVIQYKGKLLLIIDACQSAAAASAVTKVRDQAAALAELGTTYRVSTLTAAGGSQNVYGGMLTPVVVWGLSGDANENRDDVVMQSELIRFVEEKLNR